MLNIVECSSSINCATCTGTNTECTSCFVNANPPQFLRPSSNDCIVETDCDETSNFYWDTSAMRCNGK